VPNSTPSEIQQARELAGLSQTAAAALIMGSASQPAAPREQGQQPKMTYRDEHDEICYTTVETEFGNGAALCYAADGEAVTRLDVSGVWPLDAEGHSGEKSSRYERPAGLVIGMADALRLGVRRA